MNVLIPTSSPSTLTSGPPLLPGLMGVFVRDMSNVIVYWNRGAEDQYGWTSAEVVGKVSHDITGTVFPAPLDEIMGELTRTGRWEGELVHTRRDGAQLLVASRIFDVFFTTKPEGIGLGLSISRTIVEAHGGTLQAIPNEDKGATIQFTIPLIGGSES
jgi:PAS domain S-box-containing protein